MATTGQDQRRHTVLLLGACACALGLAPSAAADVMEVTPDGGTILRSGAGAVRWIGTADAAGPAGAGVVPADLPVPAGALLSAASRAPAVYRVALARIADRYALSPAILEALVWQESRWRPDAVSAAGAIGLAQLMPGTARALGVDPRDPLANLEGGARFLRAQLDRFGGDVERALAAYNAGPARVLRAGGIPATAETRAYVAAIIGRLASTPKGE